MRLILRYNFGLVFTCLSIGLASELQAQQGNKPGSRPAEKPPANKPLTIKAPPKDQPADPDAEEKARVALEKQRKMLARLDKILDLWEAESSKIKSLHGKQSRSEFNHVFAVEKVSEGPFFLETPDKGRIDLVPVTIKKGAVSKRKTNEDPPKPYSLETGKPERWICTGEAILVIDDTAKTYQREEIPEDQRGKNIVESPLPFLFGMKADDAKNRFKLSIVQETDDTVMLLAIPKMAKDQDNYQKAAITLNKKTFLPTEVRLLDQSKLEIIYSFQDVVVNDRDLMSKISKSLGKDPFKPSLKGYEPQLPPEPQIQPTGNRDSGGRPPSRTADAATSPNQSNLNPRSPNSTSPRSQARPQTGAK